LRENAVKPSISCFPRAVRVRRLSHFPRRFVPALKAGLTQRRKAAKGYPGLRWRMWSPGLRSPPLQGVRPRRHTKGAARRHEGVGWRGSGVSSPSPPFATMRVHLRLPPSCLLRRSCESFVAHLRCFPTTVVKVHHPRDHPPGPTSPQPLAVLCVLAALREKAVHPGIGGFPHAVPCVLAPSR